jgi:hypothetical protein
VRPNGSVIDELLVDKQNENVQFLGHTQVVKAPAAISAAFSLRCAGLSDTGRLQKKRGPASHARSKRDAGKTGDTAAAVCGGRRYRGHTAGDVASNMACYGLKAFFEKLTEALTFAAGMIRLLP